MADPSSAVQTINLNDIPSLMEAQKAAMSEATGIVRTAMDHNALEKAADVLLKNDRMSVEVPADLSGPDLYAALVRSTGAEMDAGGIPYPDILNDSQAAGAETLVSQAMGAEVIDAGGAGGSSGLTMEQVDHLEALRRNRDLGLSGPPDVDKTVEASYEVHMVSYPVMGGRAMQKDHLFVVVTDPGGDPTKSDQAHFVMRAGPSNNIPLHPFDTVVVSDLTSSRADLAQNNLTDQDVGTVVHDISLNEIEARLNQSAADFNARNIHYGEVPVGVQANSNTFAPYAYSAVTGGHAPLLEDMGDVPGYGHNMQPIFGQSQDGTEFARAEMDATHTSYSNEAEDEYGYDM